MSDRLAKLMKLHQADPGDPFCAYGIAMEHAKAGDVPQAMQWLDKTLTIDPAYCYAIYHKAKIMADDGEDEKAKDILRRGIVTAEQAGGADNLHAAQEMQTLLQSLSGE